MLKNVAQTFSLCRCIGNTMVGSSIHSYNRVLAVPKVEVKESTVSNAACRVSDNNNSSSSNNSSSKISGSSTSQKIRGDPNTCNVYMVQTPHRIHINLEDLTSDMQHMFCRDYVNELKNVAENNSIKVINFNCVSEDVYKYNLNMPIRKLGYRSTFQRYNEDRGLAEFMIVKDKWESAN